MISSRTCCTGRTVERCLYAVLFLTINSWEIFASSTGLDEKTEKKFWAIIEGDVTYEDIKNISFENWTLKDNLVSRKLNFKLANFL